MKGVSEKNMDKLLRNDFVRQMFLDNCKERSANGYVDPPLSAPKAQKLFKQKFGVQLNSQRMYDLRRAAFHEAGLNDQGRPVKVAPTVAKVLDQSGPVLFRDPGDLTRHVAVVPTASAAEGEFLRSALVELQRRGFVDPQLKVDGVHEHYATVSHFPK